MLGTPTTMAPEVYFRKKYGLNVYFTLYRLIYGLLGSFSFNWSLELNLMILQMPKSFMVKFNLNSRTKNLEVLMEFSYQVKLMIFFDRL